MPNFFYCLQTFKDIFENAQTCLELGAGQGWASCIVKKLFPNVRVVATDISKWALASTSKWERIFQVQLDGKKECKSYKIPENDSSISCVFCFASAHHFSSHRRTIKEIHRVLEPNGHCLYLYEPSTPSYLYSLTRWRVDRKRPEVPEDVVIYKKIQKLGVEAGFTYSGYFYPSLLKRGPIEMIYYTLLNKAPFLARFLPCTINYHFIKQS